MDCKHCKNPIYEHDATWHEACAEDHSEHRYDDGHERGREEGVAVGHDEAHAEHADSAEIRYVQDLAEAIRVGNRADAEVALDLIAAEIEKWPDAVAKGRFSRLAKAA